MTGNLYLSRGSGEAAGCSSGMARLASNYTTPAALAWTAMLASRGRPVLAALALSGPLLRLSHELIATRVRRGTAWDAWGNPASPERASLGPHRIGPTLALTVELLAGAVAFLVGERVFFPGLLVCLLAPVIATLVATRRTRADAASVPLRYSARGRMCWRLHRLVDHIPWLVGLAAGLGLVGVEVLLVGAFLVLVPVAVAVWPYRDPAAGEPDGTVGPKAPTEFDFVGPIDPVAADVLARREADLLRRVAPTFEEAALMVPSRVTRQVCSPIGARYSARLVRHGANEGPLIFSCIVSAPDRPQPSSHWQVRYERGTAPALYSPRGARTPWPGEPASPAA